MDTLAAGKWITCLKNISTQLPTEVYNTWFSELKYVSYKADTLTISVPAKMVSEFISNTSGIQENSTKEIGMLIKWMDKGSIHFKIEAMYLENSVKIILYQVNAI